MKYNIPFTACRKYDCRTRLICHGIKDAYVSSIREAALEMAQFVEQGSILVPVPSHFGFATSTKFLADCIAYLTGVKVVDALHGAARESNYLAKKSGRLVTPEKMKFECSCCFKNEKVFIVDNVLATGSTGYAAIKACGCGELLVYGIAG